MGRMEKINKQIKREISQILQRELSDPRLEFVSIMRADVSPDLKNARVYYSVLNQTSSDQQQSCAFVHWYFQIETIRYRS